MSRRPGSDNRTIGYTPSPPTIDTRRFGVGIVNPQRHERLV